MYWFLGIIGIIALYEIIAKLSQVRFQPGLDELHEDARKHRLRILGQRGDENYR